MKNESPFSFYQINKMKQTDVSWKEEQKERVEERKFNNNKN